MSVDEVRPGMKGFGKTVFQGTKIEQFDVELLGVLKNFAPKQDMILARLSGGPLARTGVIAGMSGSPVYVDGKLIGAVAFSFPFATEPIAGIQPIQQMLGLLDQKNATPPRQIAQASPQCLSTPLGGDRRLSVRGQQSNERNLRRFRLRARVTRPHERTRTQHNKNLPPRCHVASAESSSA